MARLVIGLVVELVTLAVQADTLRDAANWSDLVGSAKERGIDYPTTVARARGGDTLALKILFRHTPHTDGSDADSHCVVCAGCWRCSATGHSATRFVVSPHRSEAKSRKRSISTSASRGRRNFHSHTRSGHMILACLGPHNET